MNVVVVRSFQSKAYGNPWVAELWNEEFSIRYYRTARKFHAQGEAEDWARRQAQYLGLQVVASKRGRFPGKMAIG